ncbi:uncharacterized protein LOC130966909 [Arachis stenosperma]|uniref:uncharacterized protein LOC130966909 n=1 Tax=Arachis stenosperma TaxID=217475 RepID=UPI0025AC1533|nr:uncharacterized protein LOC130966909 [Arachis stenosperma]
MTFFETARLLADSNVTWIALVPKFVGAKEIKDLRPISMIGWKMGFGRTWRAWVRECVRSTSISILFNRSPSKPFKMDGGLCQGDSLSPFLFVLVVDVLNMMIGEAVRNGWISALLVGRDNIELSHLQFADDTIFFCPPEEETVKNYKRLLRCFEMMSGLSINFEKSNLIPVNYS